MEHGRKKKKLRTLFQALRHPAYRSSERRAEKSKGRLSKK